MVDETPREFGRRAAPGTKLFADFLERNGISHEAAARALGVSRVTAGQWACGDKRPAGQNRENIDVWTRGEVPESSWDDPGNTKPMIVPFGDSADDSGARRSPTDDEIAALADKGSSPKRRASG